MLLYQLILNEFGALERTEKSPAAAVVALFNFLSNHGVIHTAPWESNEAGTGWRPRPDDGRVWLLSKDGLKVWQRNLRALRWLVENYGRIAELPGDVQQALEETIGRTRPQIDQSILVPRAGGVRLQVIGLDGQPRSSSLPIHYAVLDDFQVLWTCAYASFLFPGAIGLPGYCAGCGKVLTTETKQKASSQALCGRCRKADWIAKNKAKAVAGRKRNGPTGSKQRSESEIPARHVAERVVMLWFNNGGSVMAKAWVRKREFSGKSHYYVEFRDHTGKRRQVSCGPGPNARRLAKSEAIKLDAELRTGKYEERQRESERQAAEESKRMTWTAFAKEYDCREIRLMPSVRTGPLVRKSLQLFGQLCGNPMLHEITADTIMDFREKRAGMKGKKPGSTISRATVNGNLRYVKAALRAAADWGHIEKAPKVKFLDELHELPRYITPEHFAAIYKACESATLPDEMHVPPGQWWEALLMFAQMTGWRIGAILALEWKDVDLDAGTAITRARDNKSKRDAVVALHPIVVEHLRPLKTFHPNVFPWEHDRTCLANHFHAIQAAAGVDLPCRLTGSHTCTTTCHRYGFHDLRRAFATMNAPAMTREALQALMGHASPLTTAGYINFAQQMKPAVANLYVPNVG